MPKVLHLIDHNGLGGAQRVVSGILEQRPGDLVFPLRTQHQPMFSPPREYPPGTAGLPILGLLQKIGPLRRWLKAHPVQIIHCHLQASWLVGIWLKWLQGKHGNTRFLFHEHNPYVIYSRNYRNLVRLAAHAGKLISVSAYLKEQLLRMGIPERRQALLPNYVDPQFFNNLRSFTALPLDAGWRLDKTVVGYAGRIVNIKGWRTVVQVAQALRHEAVVFLIAGTGRDEENMRQSIANYGLKDKIQMIGFVDQMPRFYRTIDILLFPSEFEVFGLAPLEAQACGVPVVAADIPGVNEVISQNNAILVKPDNPNEMAASIKRLIANADMRNKLIAEGQQNSQQYTIENYLPHLEQIYISVTE
jgi:glycosyltransferase involved in cell wall biosynthesis